MNTTKTGVIFFLMMFLVIIGNAQDLPTYLDARSYNPDKPTERLFYESFANNNNNWALATNESGYASLDGNLNRFEYKSRTVKGKEDQWLFNYLGRLPIDLDRDYVINVNIAFQNSDVSSACYFFWGESMANRYALGFRGDGTARYEFGENNRWDEPRITSFPSSWRGYLYLNIVKKGSIVSIYNNSATPLITAPYHFLNTTNKNLLPNSMLGFILHGNAKIECSKIEVLQNREYGTRADSAYFLSYDARAKAGDPAALYQLANMYWQGKGTSIDKTKAAALYQRAADKGHVESLANTGWIYEQQYQRSGSRKELDSAIACYKQAVLQTGNTNSRYFASFMKAAYPYVSWLDYHKYSLENPPLPEQEFLAAEKARTDLIAKISEDAHFKLLPVLYAAEISINQYDDKNCYVEGSGKRVPLLKLTPATLQDRDLYFDAYAKEFVLYRKGLPPRKQPNNATYLYAVRGGYQAIHLLWEEKPCKTCNGKGFTGGGYGSQTVYTPTGRYTTTRTQTIVGQTEIVTYTPIYATSTVNVYIPPVKCKECDGAGKFPKECKTVLKIQ